MHYCDYTLELQFSCSFCCIDHALGSSMCLADKNVKLQMFQILGLKNMAKPSNLLKFLPLCPDVLSVSVV